MPELDAFERSLEAAFRAFADRGVTPVDAVAFAERAAARPRRRAWLARPPAPGRLAAVPAIAWVLLATGLVLGLVVGSMAGGLWRDPSRAVEVAPSPAPSPTATSIASSCVVATLAGQAGEFGAVDGTGAEARFSEEMGFIAYDADERVLYLADSGNHAIRRITLDGVVTTIAGKLGKAGNVDGGGSAARFDTPVGVSLWGGQLFIADSGRGTLRLMDVSDGAVITLATGLSSPWSLAMRASWSSAVLIYVGEIDGGAIRYVYAPGGGGTEGVVYTLAGDPGNPDWTVDGPGLGWPFGMSSPQEDGDIYVVDVNQERSRSALRLISRRRGVTTTLPWDGRYGRPGVPWAPSLWEADSGNLFLTTFLDDTVVRRDADGTMTLLAGSPGVDGSTDGTGDVARFSGPMGIVGDGEGTLYVVDAYNGTIRTITCP